jgi:hypothetical protein
MWTPRRDSACLPTELAVLGVGLVPIGAGFLAIVGVIHGGGNSRLLDSVWKMGVDNHVNVVAVAGALEEEKGRDVGRAEGAVHVGQVQVGMLVEAEAPHVYQLS